MPKNKEDIQFKILSVSDLNPFKAIEKLEKAVNKVIADGWSQTGTTFQITRQSGYDCILCQPITKRKNK